MSGGESDNSVTADEILFRRIPLQMDWYTPPPKEFLSKNAFKPHRKNDPDGLSVSRAHSDRHPEFLTAEQLGSQGRSAGGYYVVRFSAKALFDKQIEITPDPIVDDPNLPDDPGHSILPQLRSDNRNSDFVTEIIDYLARSSISVEGPFYPSAK